MWNAANKTVITTAILLLLASLNGCSGLWKRPYDTSTIVPHQVKEIITEKPEAPMVKELPQPTEQKKASERKEKGISVSKIEQKPSARFGLVSKRKPSRKIHVPEKHPQQRQKIVLNFEKADIHEVTHQIFGQILKVNYVVDPSLRMPVTFYLEGQYSNSELLNLIAQIYSAHGVDVVLKNGIYHIQLTSRTRGGGLQLISPDDLKSDGGAKPGICLYRLQFLGAKQAQNLIKPFISPNRPVVVEPATNTLIVVDSIENIRTLVEMLHILDVNIFNEMGIEIVKLNFLSPREAADAFDAIAKKLSPTYKDMITRNLVVFPMDRISSVILVSPDEQILQTAREWLKALDTEGENAGEQFYVYFVQNGLAKNIVDILKAVFTNSSSAAESHLTQHIVKSTEKIPETQPKTTGAEGVSAQLRGKISIIADETNNAIIVKALPEDYAKIKKAIESLDVLPRAVLIEMLIAEITLNDEIQYGVEWFLKNKGMDIGGYKGQYSLTQDYGVPFNKDFDLGTAATKGLSFYWGSIGGDISALIHLLSTYTHFNVLSAPTLIATDNQKATITVGGSTPIISQQSIDTAGNTLVNTVQYVDTGIILNVTPHINAGGLVRLEIEQTIRNAVKNSVSGIDSPEFTERKISTTLLAKDGSTVVIGGIIQQRSNSTRNGIPFLSRIPIIAPLFSSTTTKADRTELLLAITPKIIDHTENAASAEFLRKLKMLKGILTGELEEKRQMNLFGIHSK